jgi:type I restriction enzyme S subunit
VKATWTSKPIGDVFKVINGGTPKTGIASNWDGPHAWITPAEMGNLETPFISESRRTLTDEGLRTGAELVPAGSIILSSRAPIGHLVINKIPMAFNQGCKGLIPSLAIDTKFAYYFLLTNVPLLERLGTGATFKELSGSKLKEVPFRYPELGEQRRIVTLLDEAFYNIATAKANAENCLKNSKELLASFIQASIAGIDSYNEHKTLDELCVIGDGNHSSNYPTKDELVEIGIPFIRCTNLIDGRISNVDMRFLSPEKHAQLKKGHLKTGDVLVTNRGEIGRTAIVDETHDGSNLNSQIAWLRCKDGLSNKYLFHALNSSGIQKHFESSKSGAALQQFTIKQLKALQIPLPTFEKQLATVKKLDFVAEQTEVLSKIYTQKIAALNELKLTFLNRAFSDQL